MNATTVNDLVNEALQRWVDLTGLELDEDRLNVRKLGKGCPWQAWDVKRHTDALNDSRTLDPGGLTTFMLLRGLLESYLTEIRFSAHDLILDPASIETQLGPMRAIRDLLETPEVVQLVAEFQQQLRDAAGHYGMRQGKPWDRFETLLGDRYQLALVRRDALLSMQNMEVHQFTQGPPDPKPLQYSPQVFEFWNMNSVLAAMRSQKVPGISLCLIRDPVEVMHSYFVFAVRNGGTLTILTDRNKDPHPAYKRMSRRPDRTLESRAAQNWFPYDLLELVAVEDEEGRRKRLAADARKQLVPMNAEAVPLKEVRDLYPEQFVWTTLVFDLLRDRYWTRDEKTEDLSYTGQMVVEPQALVGAQGALVKDGLYRPLELPRLTGADVTDETTKEQWEMEPTGFYRWMVGRYGQKVPDEVLNPVGAQAKALLEERVANDKKFLPLARRPKGLKAELEKVKYETLDPTNFGRAVDIVRDRLWVARMNQVHTVQRLADDEYEAQKDRVIAWYQKALLKNRDFLFNAAAAGTLILPNWLPRRFGFGPGERDEDRIETIEAMTQRRGTTWWRAFEKDHMHWPEIHLGSKKVEEYMLDGWRQRRKRWFECGDQPPCRASIFTRIKVTCPEALAIVCGVAVDEMPWPLQHWYSEQPYFGNPILDRIDPMDFRLRNPWMPHRGWGVNLNIGIALSKRAYKARRKALGLPAEPVPTTTKDDEDAMEYEDAPVDDEDADEEKAAQS